MAMPEMQEHPEAIEVGQSLQLSRPKTVNDGHLVSKYVCQKFVPLFAAVSAHGNKVVLQHSKEALAKSQSVSKKIPYKSLPLEIYNENAGKVKAILQGTEMIEMITSLFIYSFIYLFVYSVNYSNHLK